jgi:DNA-binding winged helix-turn-helix (wHTH) protein
MLKQFGEFELDESLRRVSRGGQPVRLTGQALDLLCLLAKRPGELISREDIQHYLWPDSNVDLEHNLDVLLNRLRVILGDSGKSPRYIETVPRRGFRFLAHVECGQYPSNRLLIRPLVRKVWTYAAIAMLAATVAILLARTRYQRFIPPEHSAVSTNSSPQAR